MSIISALHQAVFPVRTNYNTVSVIRNDDMIGWDWLPGMNDANAEPMSDAFTKTPTPYTAIVPGNLCTVDPNLKTAL